MSKRNYAEYAEKDLRSKADGRQNQTQSRTTPLPLKSHDPDTITSPPQAKAKSQRGGK